MDNKSFPSRPTEIMDNDSNTYSRATEIMNDDVNQQSRPTEIMNNDKLKLSRPTELLSSNVNSNNPTESYTSRKRQELINLGDVIGSGYELTGVIAQNTGEAIIFLCEKDNQEYVAKIYHSDNKPKDEIAKFLKENKSEYVIKIIEEGEVKGRYFEIQDYFCNKDLLSNLPISNEFIINTIVPCINEGLNVIHSNGIIHKDIKPNNIFLSNDKKRVVIGDFGISSMLENGLSVRVTKAARTVGYSAPETLMLQSSGSGFSMSASKEGDYYAFGISLLHLVLGRDPFKGMNDTQILLLTAQYKLTIPDGIPTRLRQLIRGLTIKDRQDRWGYEEVKRWLNNENVEIHEKSYVRTDIRPYEFEGEKIDDLKKLALKFAESWNEGKKRLYSNAALTEQFIDFIKQFGPDVTSKCLDNIRDTEEHEDHDNGLLKMIYILDPKAPLCWYGDIYASLDSLFKVIIEQSPDIEVKYADMLRKGAISEFYKSKGFPDEVIDEIRDNELLDDKELGFFFLMCLLENYTSLHWRRKSYNGPIELSKAIMTADKNKKKDFIDLLKSGALSIYLVSVKVDRGIINEIIALQSEKNTDLALFKLIYALNPDAPFYWYTEEIEDISVLSNKIIRYLNYEYFYGAKKADTISDYRELNESLRLIGIQEVFSENKEPMEDRPLNEIYDLLCSGAIRYFLKIKGYDHRLVEMIEKLEIQVHDSRKNREVLLYALAYTLNPKEVLFWRNEKLVDLEGLRDVIKNTLPKSNYDYLDLVQSRVLNYFLKMKGYDSKWNKEFEKISSETNRKLAYFKLIYILIPDAAIIWNGKEYSKLEDCRYAPEEILSSGALYHYLKFKVYDAQLTSKIKALSNRSDTEKAFYEFKFLIDPNNKFYYDSKFFSDLDELKAYLLEVGYEKGIASVEEILAKLSRNKGFSVWLKHLGYDDFSRVFY